MAVRSKELGAVRGAVANTPVTLFTVDPGETVIVKDVRVLTVGTAIWTLQVTRAGVGYQVGRRLNTTVPFEQHNGWFLVLEPGDSLSIAWTTTDTVHQCWVSGAELAGVA